ncbi:MAG: DUF1080 domain-containing protein [Pirellulales bacterium]
MRRTCPDWGVSRQGLTRVLMTLMALATWGLAGSFSSVAIGAELAEGLTAEELADGWISLFDGQTLDGWKQVGKADWRVEDGAIVVSQGEVSFLQTTAQFSDYVLRVEFRADPGTNSGVFLRTSPLPKDVLQECYELNIAGQDNPFPTGSLVQRIKRAGAPTTGEWQQFDVRVEGARITVSLDGQQIVEYEDPQPLGRGYISLQHNQGPVAFRKIYLKPLGLQPIFNGQDLSGWSEAGRREAQFAVTADKTLQVTGGPGQLESAGQYGDFVLQFAARTPTAETNSGLFFRCIPGDQLMGYESQIHHGYLEGDRNRPADGGTGGIFRRQPARRVMTDPGEWFYETLVVTGPRMSVWVNGRLVTDWVDTRGDDPNPRRGRRLAAGTLMLQGHDPTTSAEFRGVQVAELAPRRPAGTGAGAAAGAAVGEQPDGK